jgi:capsular polysaccharide transport system ATP-binding protein
MNARLAMAASLAVEFDCYLVDEITSAGDERFRERCRAALVERRERGTLVMVSHDQQTLREHCTTGAVLENGRLTFYGTIDEAIAHHFERAHEAA